MILDPRAILHLALVEYRWLALLYFTVFQVIVSTQTSITNHAESDIYVDLIRCAGAGKFNAMFAEAQVDVVLHGENKFTLEVASCDPEGEPGPMGCPRCSASCGTLLSLARGYYRLPQVPLSCSLHCTLQSAVHTELSVTRRAVI